jgi:chloramphenicol 3-O-phosphotransferase
LELERFPQVIVVAGAPGSGKSSLSHRLQAITRSPLFEFGWIPEYRYRSNGEIPYPEEEQISFENLVLVTRNYVRHGFRAVILTDLEDHRIAQIAEVFSDLDYCILTLVVHDEEVLSRRVLDPDRTSGYRDVAAALDINRRILGRSPYLKEFRLDVTDCDLDCALQHALDVIQQTHAGNKIQSDVTGK